MRRMHALVVATVAAAGAVSVWTDLTERRIPNGLTVPALGALVALAAWAGGRAPAASLESAAIAFAVFAPAAALGLVGWGDAKLAAALAAAGDPLYARAFLLWTGLASGALAAGYVASRVGKGTLALAAAGDWPGAIGLVRERLRDPVPYGPAIVLGALLAMWKPGNGW